MPMEDTLMKLLSRLLLASCLISSAGLALAAPGPQDHDDHDRHGHDRGHDEHHDRGWGDDHDRGRWDRDRHDDDRRWRDHDDRRGRYYGYDGPRYGGRHHWERGHRYYGPTYVVRDYGYHRLRPPPRGYHWIRDDNNDYLLVAIATGVILDIALH